MRDAAKDRLNLGSVLKLYAADVAVWLYLLVEVILLAFLIYLYNTDTASTSIWSVLAWIAVGWCIYVAEEYFTHVWVFHMPAPKHKLLYRLLYRLHMGHHDAPKRMDMIMTPLWFTFPVFLINAVLFYAVAPNSLIAASLTAGVVVGYLVFEWFHVLIHSPYHLTNRWLSFIKERHNGHHHINEPRWFTVTPAGSILDDLLFTGGRVGDQVRTSNPYNGDLEENDQRVRDARFHYAPRSDGLVKESRIWLRYSYI